MEEKGEEGKRSGSLLWGRGRSWVERGGDRASGWRDRGTGGKTSEGIKGFDRGESPMTSSVK